MLFETKVIDHIIPHDAQETVKKLVLGGDWKLVSDMSYNNSDKPSYGLNQMFKHPDKGVMSPLYEIVAVPILNVVLEKLGITITDCNHSRSFLQLPLRDEFLKEHNGIHVDLPIPHLACVYYVNDSDGDTVLYEQTWNNTIPNSSNNVMVEHARVTPKQGRFVVFDGMRYHCSTQPTTGYRCIINFNLIGVK
jgi:hypothetical protein